MMIKPGTGMMPQQGGGMMPQPGTGMMPQQGGDNTISKPQSSAGKNMCINFFVNSTEIIIGVQGNTNMTVQQLIKNFRIKLCNDKINFAHYITHPTKIELDRNSTETLGDLGINQDITVNAIVAE